MTVERNCLTCASRATSLDDSPPSCWTCAAKAPDMPNWRPKTESLGDLLKRKVIKVTPVETPSGNPLDIQVGGSHYKDMVIQPVEFITANNLGFCAGNVIKYVCRADKKGGLQDLEKARHYIDLLISMGKKSNLKG